MVAGVEVAQEAQREWILKATSRLGTTTLLEGAHQTPKAQEVTQEHTIDTESHWTIQTTVSVLVNLIAIWTWPTVF